MKVLSQGSFCAFGFRITFLFVTLHVSKTKRASYQFSQMKGLGTGGHCKLQALVYYILPSTTAVFSFAIGSRKKSANEQFFCWCSNSSTFVTNNSNYI